MKDRESVLKHKTRRMILNYIKKHPGTRFRELKDTFDLTDGTLRYHLGYLDRGGEIRTKFKGGKKLFFPTDMSIDRDDDDPGLSRDDKRLFSIIKREPGVTKKELHQMTNLSRKDLERCLRRLSEGGKVRSFTRAGKTVYKVPSRKDMEKEVFKLLVIKLINNEIDEDTFNFLKDELEGR